jgi:putative MATE family efflux protein
MHERMNELGNEPIRTLLVRYSMPAMVAMFVNSMYNLVDTIFVGYGPGTLALAALAVSWPIQMVIVAMGMAVGIGTASVVSRSLGARDTDRANRVAGTSFVTIAVLALVITGAAYVFMQPLLRLFGATDNIMPYAVDYLSIIFIGNFFMASAISANNIIRSEGAARIAMIGMIIGAVINTVLDPVFIFGFDMGIRGAAVATVIANISTFIFICWYFMSGRSMLKIHRYDLIPDLSELPEVFKIGSASFFSMIVGSLMAIPINGLIIKYGADIHLAIMGVGNRAMMFFFMPIFGLTQGLQPIIGFNYGAKNLDRVRETVRTAASYSTILSSMAFLVLMFGTWPILRMFSPDPELIAEGVPIMRTIVICMPFVGFQMVGGAFFQALGQAAPAFVLTISRQVLVLLPLIFFLPQYYGLNGLWASFPMADFTSTVITIVWVLFAVRTLEKNYKPMTAPAEA